MVEPTLFQHCCRWWSHAVTWANIDQVLVHHMVSLHHNELTQMNEKTINFNNQAMLNPMAIGFNYTINNIRVLLSRYNLSASC